MYLKTFGICLVVGLALGAPKGKGGGGGGGAKKPVPPKKVKEIDCKEMEKELKLDGSFDFCVKIEFPKDERVLYGGLTYYVDDDGVKYEDLYEGTVIEKNEEKWVQNEETRISMNDVDPDDDVATMVIVNGEESYQLKVYLETDEAKPDHPDKSYGDTEEPLKKLQDRWFDQALREKLIKAYRRQKSKPTSVVLNIQFVAEQYFVDKYGKTEVRKRIAAVENHLKSMYKHKSLPVVINAKFPSVVFMDEKVLITGDNRDWFGQEAAKKVAAGTWPQADTYILLGPENKNGFYGVANGGWNLNEGVCSTNVAKKVSINWYETSTWNTKDYADDLLTALTVVHENGHNLGMRHDFKDENGKPTRTATMTGNPCKGVQGYMDYVFPPYSDSNKVPELFSDCSGEDWEAHYMQVVAARGSYCLDTTCDNGPCDTKITPEKGAETDNSCKDVSSSSSCSDYANKGECSDSSWKSWMQKNCKATCNSRINRDDSSLERVCQHFKANCAEGTITYNYENEPWRTYTLDFKRSCRKTCCMY